MAKQKGFICTACEAFHASWYGRCPNCGAWASLEEQFENPSPPEGFTNNSSVKPSPVHRLHDGSELDEQQWPSRIPEFDRVLGGGAVAGSSVLLGGDPGIGKSTLMLQFAAAVDVPVYYISGEETLSRIHIRAKRLQLMDADVRIVCDTEINQILQALADIHHAILIFDSIQTMHLGKAGTQAGSISQVRSISQMLIEFARSRHVCVFIVSHVTKEGSLAGPKQLEHLVDTVLLFEHGDSDLRYIRATKNRFGAIDELGVFALEETGLQALRDPSMRFQVPRPSDKPMPSGTISVPIFEGSRVFVIEVQALTITSHISAARVYSDKIDARRIARIAAVLEKTIGVSFSDQDIYINVAGGITIKDVSSDLALAMALYSARTAKPLPHRCCAIGELSLAGEIRSVPLLKQRIRAVQESEYSHCLAPPGVEESYDYITAVLLLDAIKALYPDTGLHRVS